MFKSFVYYNKVEMSKSLNLNRLNLVFNSNLNKVTKTDHIEKKYVRKFNSLFLLIGFFTNI